MDIYTQQVYEDQRTFDMMVATYPILYAHLGADFQSKYNAIYATKEDEKHLNNLSQFKLQMAIKGSSCNNYLRVNTYYINGKPAIPLQKVRHLHTSRNKDHHYVLLLDTGFDYYYSVDNHEWLDWEQYYTIIEKPADTIMVSGNICNIPARKYRVYDMEKLEAVGAVFHFHSITRKVTCGGKEIVDFSGKDITTFFPGVPESIEKINTVRRDNKLSTLIYMDYEDCVGNMGYLVSVQGLARKIAELEGSNKKAVADRIRKTIKAKRLTPVGKLGGKNVYVSLKKINLEAALKENIDKKNASVDRNKMTKRVKTWLVRHDWSGVNNKWTDEERQVAFELVIKHRNKEA